MPLDCATQLAPYFSRLLALRLKQGPKDGADAVDTALVACLKAFHDGTRIFPEVSDLSHILRDETWGEAGVNLRVSQSQIYNTSLTSL